MKQYDVIFVLPGLSGKYPAGGFDVVYRLANCLNLNGVRCGIVFLKDPSVFIPNYKRTIHRTTIKKLLLYIFNKIFNNKRIKYFYKLIMPIFTDYNYTILNNTDLYYYGSIRDFVLNTKIIFATAWQTAYFVNEITNKKMFKAYYLIPHSEDDRSSQETIVFMQLRPTILILK